MSHLLGHALGLAALALLVGVPGSALARRLGPLPPALGRAAPWCCGAALWMLAVFSLSAAGWLRPPALTLCAAAVLLAAAVALRRPRTNAADSPSVDTRGTGAATPGGRWLAVAVGALLVPPALLAVNPTVSWDAAVYHLALPRLELDTGHFAAPPFLVYAHWPRGVELLYTLALWLGDLALGGSHMLAKLTHWGFGLLTVLTLARCGPDKTTGRLAGGLFLLNGVVLFELHVAYVDVAMAFFALVTFLGACAAADATTRSRALAALSVAGLGAGLLTASKLTGALVAGCMLLPLLPRVVRDAGHLGARAALRPLLERIGLPIAAAGACWAAKAWWSTGNPVYPLAYDFFGGPHWSADLSRRLTTWQQGIGMGRAPIDYLLLPWRVVVDGGPSYARFDGRLTLAWLVALPCALWRLRTATDPRIARALTASGAYFVLWAASAQQMRFLIPILPVLTLAAATAIVNLAGAMAIRRPRLRPLGAPLAALALLLVFVAENGALAASGARHLGLYLSRPVPPTAPRPAVFEAAATLPDDARLLLLGTNQILHSPRPTVADSFFEASQIADWLRDAESPTEVAERLAARGLTHVVWTAGAEAIYPRHVVALLGDPRFARPLWRGDRHVLLVLRPPTPPVVAPPGSTR